MGLCLFWCLFAYVYMYVLFLSLFAMVLVPPPVVPPRLRVKALPLARSALPVHSPARLRQLIAPFAVQVASLPRRVVPIARNAPLDLFRYHLKIFAVTAAIVLLCCWSFC